MTYSAREQKDIESQVKNDTGVGGGRQGKQGMGNKLRKYCYQRRRSGSYRQIHNTNYGGRKKIK